MVGSEKPNREIYINTLSSFSLVPCSTLFIDDKVENVEAAQACGIQAYHLRRDKGENLSALERHLAVSSKPYLCNGLQIR